MDHQENYQISTEEPPPVVVVVQGSKESGKSTLIKSLVSHYTKQKINNIQGSVTIRASKNQRITFYECPTTIQGMIDLAKICDLALILIDASIGFEMETFEFLCILHNHGMPAVMGVLTHLDYFKENKALGKTKKRMKKRFWKEVHDGAKLFYLSGVQGVGTYFKNETHNLARFISVIKPKVTLWKSTHSSVLTDRFEVIESANAQETHSTVNFYGYVRGTGINAKNPLHINGLGDYQHVDIRKVDDPCPVEYKIIAGEKKKRTLKQKERSLYAPQSSLGTINFDRTSGYISIPDQYVMFTKITDENNDVINETTNEGQRLVRELQDIDQGIDDQSDEDIDLIEGVNIDQNQETGFEKKQVKQKAGILRTINEEGEQGEDEVEYKHIKKSVAFKENPVRSLYNLIYASTEEEEEDTNQIDTSKYTGRPALSVSMYKRILKKRFVSGKNMEDVSDSEEEEKGKKGKKGNKGKEDEEEQEQEEEEKEQESSEEEQDKKGAWRKKKNTSNPEEEKKQLMEQYMTEEYGHYKKGTYLKIQVKIEKGIARELKPGYPIVLCSLLHHETKMAFLRVKIKKHRWFPHIQKNRDPLIFSIGWRRFQSVPVFVSEDDNKRMRQIKYTPKFGFCYALIYAPYFPIGTPFIGMSSVSEDSPNFRISVTGVVLEINQSFMVMKKLKLIGEAFEIHKNTAYVKGMFNSDLEVARYMGAQLKTVSGIRGQIKKSIKGPPGSYRATFEDKILKSDLIFCRTWYQVDLPKLYNPVIEYGEMRMMKTTAQVRVERGLKVPNQKDSQYIQDEDALKQEREERVFAPLKVPKALAAALPFKSKVKVNKFQEVEKQGNVHRVKILEQANLPTKLPFKRMYMNDEEKKIHSLVQRLTTIGNQNHREQRTNQTEYMAKVKKREEKHQEKLRAKIKRKKRT